MEKKDFKNIDSNEMIKIGKNIKFLGRERTVDVGKKLKMKQNSMKGVLAEIEKNIDDPEFITEVKRKINIYLPSDSRMTTDGKKSSEESPLSAKQQVHRTIIKTTRRNLEEVLNDILKLDDVKNISQEIGINLRINRKYKNKSELINEIMEEDKYVKKAVTYINANYNIYD